MHLEVRFVPGVYRSDRLCSHTAVLTLGILTAHCQVSRTGPESAIYVCPSRGHTAVHPRNARDRRMYHVELTKDEFRRKPISQVITRCASSRTAVNYVKQYVLLVLCCKKQDFNPLCIYIYVRRTAVCSCGIHIQSELLSYSAGDNVFYMFTPRYSYVLVDSVRLVRTLRTYVRTYVLLMYLLVVLYECSQRATGFHGPKNAHFFLFTTKAPRARAQSPGIQFSFAPLLQVASTTCN